MNLNRTRLAQCVALAAVGLTSACSATSSTPTSTPVATTAAPTASSPVATAAAATAATTTGVTAATTTAATTAATDGGEPTQGPLNGLARNGSFAKDSVIYTSTSTIDLAPLRPAAFWTLANGSVVVQPEQGAALQPARLVDKWGKRVGQDTYGLNDIRVSADRTRFASADSTGVQVHSQDGTRLARLAQTTGEPLTLAGLSGDTVWLSSPKASVAWNWRTGATSSLPAGLKAVNTAGTLGAYEAMGSDKGKQVMCTWLTDLAAGTQKWRTCQPSEFSGAVPVAFSPDDTHLLVDNNADGGYYFAWGALRVSDGSVAVATATVQTPFKGWSIAPSDSGHLMLVANTSSANPATQSELQKCTWTGQCSELLEGATHPVGDGPLTRPPFVVGR